jgi:hypothetical protein
MMQEIEQLKSQLQQKTQGYHTVVTNMCTTSPPLAAAYTALPHPTLLSGAAFTRLQSLK